MANQIAPRGFVPSRYLNGAAWNGGANMYVIPAADALIYSIGDAVKSAANSDFNGIPAIQKANAGDVVRGVIVGILLATPNNPSFTGTILDSTVQNTPAVKSRAYYALVVDDPTVIFEIQDDGLAALTATSANKNANFTVANPIAPSQNSQTVLATASVAVTATLPLKMIGLLQKANVAFGVNATWLVRFNQHELMGNTAGV